MNVMTDVGQGNGSHLMNQEYTHVGKGQGDYARVDEGGLSQTASSGMGSMVYIGTGKGDYTLNNTFVHVGEGLGDHDYKAIRMR
eukprot:8401941-Heterocapsa_arctica.AAC.1